MAQTLVKSTAVAVPVGSEVLNADLALPPTPCGLVLFAHGSGSGRHSPRNQFVARQLQTRGLGTLLADLLTQDEEVADRGRAHLRFNIDLLAERLVALVDWARREPSLGSVPFGLFGASTGAAAALAAAVSRPADIAAVVSRGGRPDLARLLLPRVATPTLLIVGGLDVEVLELNRWAQNRMRCLTSLQIVPGATHLFEEPGALEQAASLAAEWFVRHLRPTIRPTV